MQVCNECVLGPQGSRSAQGPGVLETASTAMQAAALPQSWVRPTWRASQPAGPSPSKQASSSPAQSTAQTSQQLPPQLAAAAASSPAVPAPAAAGGEAGPQLGVRVALALSVLSLQVDDMTLQYFTDQVSLGHGQ